MEAVGQFDEHDAGVIEHSEEHLAEVLGLLVGLTLVLVWDGAVGMGAQLRYRAELGDPLDQVRDDRAKPLLYVIVCDWRVFYDIMEEGGL